MNKRKTKSIDNRDDMKFTPIQTQTQNFNDEKDIQRNQQKDSLSKKVDKFISVNKKHQFDEVCVCQDCIYVKQLQRYESLKMDLSKNSSYRAQYNKNNFKRNLSKTQNLTDSSFTSRPQQSNISKNPYVHLGSVYRNEYASRSLQKVEKPHPADLLKFTGPTSTLSSYKQTYANLNGSFQYVEPLRQEHLPLPPRKFKAQSLYANDFKGSKVVQTQSGKINDQLRLGKPSMVKESTQRSQYVNPENYNLKSQRYSSNENKRIQEPNFSFQYKTINKDQFQKPPSKKNCRAKRLQILHGQLLTSQNFSTII